MPLICPFYTGLLEYFCQVFIPSLKRKQILLLFCLFDFAVVVILFWSLQCNYLLALKLVEGGEGCLSPLFVG